MYSCKRAENYVCNCN
jgi:ATP-dependent DNA helicase DinG